MSTLNVSLGLAALRRVPCDACHSGLLAQKMEAGTGRPGWDQHVVVAPPEMKMFDLGVRQLGTEFDAISERVWMEPRRRRLGLRGDAEPCNLVFRRAVSNQRFRSLPVRFHA